jgi:hypothetical protein
MSTDRVRTDLTTDEPKKSETDASPFGIPPVTSGYPLEPDERAAIERIMQDDKREAV